MSTTEFLIKIFCFIEYSQRIEQQTSLSIYNCIPGRCGFLTALIFSDPVWLGNRTYRGVHIFLDLLYQQKISFVF